MNSPLIESILKEMFNDLTGNNWLAYVFSFLQTRLRLSISTSDFDTFKSSLQLIDRATFRRELISSCHAVCYPPSERRAAYYVSINLPSASEWICFSSAASHYRLSRLFVSNSFRFSRQLRTSTLDNDCDTCHEPPSVEHWFSCPVLAADRAFFQQGTNIILSRPSVLPDIFRSLELTVAFEYVLSRYFNRTRSSV